MADQVLYMGVRGVTDLMMAHGLINLDFADVKAVMLEMGKAMMGTGEADGDNRAIRAAEAAINNPLLEDTSMSGAKGLLINITGGEDLTLFEVDQAVTRIRDEVDEEANVIFGSAIDETLNGRIRVSVVATGIDSQHSASAKGPRLVSVGSPTAEPQPIPLPAFAVSQTAASQGPMPQLRQMSSVREVPMMEAPQPVFTRPEPPRPMPAAASAMQAAQQPQRQPVQPAFQPAPAMRSDSRPALFAAPGQPQAAAPVSVPASTPAFTAYVAPNAGPSIFSRVTGALAFKRRSAGVQDASPRPESSYSPNSVTPAAAPDMHDRETDGGDIENVPAFLRRQQSTH